MPLRFEDLMTEIIPAILPKNYEDLKNKIALVRSRVPIVQVDICDGVFVKNTTWPFIGGDFDYHFTKILNEEEGMPFWEDIEFELDLMVSDSVSNFDVYTKLGPKRIVFHIEAVGNLNEFKDFLEGIDMYIKDSIDMGIAISPNTPIENIFPFVPHVSFVQVMGIDHVGFQGEDFDKKCLASIKILKEKFPELIVSVDGAIDLKTAPEVIDAGAERLIIGSAIFNTDDIIDAIEKFKNI